MTFSEMREIIRDYENISTAKSFLEHQLEQVTEFLKYLSNDHVNQWEFSIDARGKTNSGLVRRDVFLRGDFTIFIKTALKSYCEQLQIEVIQLGEKLKQLEVGE